MVEIRMETSWLSDNLTEAVKTDCNFVEKCPVIAIDIQEKNVELVTFVNRLGSVLTDKDPQIRFRAFQILAQVLQNLPKDFLLETELNFISSFFIGRLADNHFVPSVLDGILAIAEMSNVTSEFCVLTLENIFRHIHCQTLNPEDRRTMYTIVQLFMHKYTKELQALGLNFVIGFMSMIEEEKNPHNLLIVFGMIPYFVNTFQLEHLTEEMFELIACYFPVDFREDPGSIITREALANSLQSCLVASPNFAPFCMQALLEKLNSSLKQARLDSFKLLIAGCEVFPIESVEAYLQDLWKIFQREILPGTDKEVQDQGLAALKAVIRMLSASVLNKQEAQDLSNIMSLVLTAGINSLCEVQHNLFLPAVRMMLTVAEATPPTCENVSRKVIPVLMKQYYRETGTDQKVIVLKALTSFVAECQKQKVTPSENADVGPLWVDIPSLYISAAQLDQKEIQSAGFNGLTVAVKCLSESNRSALYEIINKHIQEEDQTVVREDVLSCLRALSRIYTEEVMNNIVIPKVTEIPNLCANKMLQNLDALCKIADEEPFTSEVVPYLVDLIIKPVSLEKCIVAMKCLRKLLASVSNESKIFRFIYLKCAVVSRLVSWWLQGVNDDKYPLIFESEEVLFNTAKILDIVMKNQSSQVQNDVVLTFIPKFLNPNVCYMVEGPAFKPLDYSSSWKHTQMVVILEGLVCSLRQDVHLIDYYKLIVYLAQLSIHSLHQPTQLSAARLLANIINKAPQDENLSKVLSEVQSEGRTIINETKYSVNEKINASHIFVWVVKALVMRGHPDFNDWIENVLELLANPIVGLKIAQGFSIIMDQNVEYLNISNFCNVKIFYRQRFFQITPKLVLAFHSADQSNKPNYLMALAYMLQGVPKKVLLMDINTMVPLLVESLELKEELLLLTVLDTLESCLSDSDQALRHHLQTFIPRILSLTSFQGCMQIRMKALQCIYHFSKYQIELILPFKKQVLQTLGKCLDDHKRLVRREAVRARLCWFVV